MYYFKNFKQSDDGIHKYEITFENDENKRTKTVKFGAKGYNDYTIYYKEDGKKKADEMKDAYIARHKVNENWSKSGMRTAGFWSRWLLWEKPTLTGAIKNIEERFNVKIKYIN